MENKRAITVVGGLALGALAVYLFTRKAGAGPSSNKPVINSFIATPAEIQPGQSSTLSWNVSGATSISIDNGIGTVQATGSLVVSPVTGTSYIITARNAVGTVTRWATVIVTGTLPPLPFTIVEPKQPEESPSEIYSGDIGQMILTDINMVNLGLFTPGTELEGV